MTSTGRKSLLESVAAQQLEFNFDADAILLTKWDRSVEPLLTIAEACGVFNLKPHVLRRAIKARSVPSYRLGNGRIRLRASDISAAIESSRSGGAK
jgi:excisionase family DNA binding protein